MGMFKKADGSPLIRRRSRLALVALAVGAASVFATAMPASAAVTLDVRYTDGNPQVVNLQTGTFRMARRDKIVGNMNLSMFSNGNFNFDVHAINNLAARRNVGWMCVVKSSSGTAYTFSHSAIVMAAGDDHYDMTTSGMKENLRDDWPNVWNGTTSVCSMNISGDLRGLWQEIHPDLGEVKDVVAIVGTFLG
jgi:hypothetical protein